MVYEQITTRKETISYVAADGLVTIAPTKPEEPSSPTKNKKKK